MKNLSEKELRKIVRKSLQEKYYDDDDNGDLGTSFGGGFDETEFEGPAKEFAKKDITASGEEFEELGTSKFEKAPKFKEKFKAAINKSDDEEIKRLANVINKKKEHEKSFGVGSMNEIDVNPDSKLNRPKDAEGNPITLGIRVEHIETNTPGRVDKFIIGDSGEMMVRVNWIQDSMSEKMPKDVPANKIVVRDKTKIVREDSYLEENSSRYMFFQNLSQMKRQTEILLNLDENKVNEILENGHDWAQDHIATAKESMDQVFDFIMNETKKDKNTKVDIEDNDTVEESNIRSHANGRGQNKKPGNYPKQFKRDALREDYDFSREEVSYQDKKEYEEEMDREVYYVVDNEFNQSHYPDLIGKTFESPPSYAQVKLVKQKDIAEGDSISLANKHGENEKPDNLQESYGDRYEQIVFLDGQEANHALNILMEDGQDAAMDYLKQWHYPGEHDGSNELGKGSLDKTYEKDGYTMIWNSSLGYIGLVYDTQYGQETAMDEDSQMKRHLAGQREKEVPLGQHAPHSQAAKNENKK